MLGVFLDVVCAGWHPARAGDEGGVELVDVGGGVLERPGQVCAVDRARR